MSRWSAYGVVGLWCLAIVFFFHPIRGDDLSSIYVGSVLMSEGNGAHLYDRHDLIFDRVDSPTWLAAATDHRVGAALHPYVQTPLWSWALQPMVGALSFQAFCLLNLVLSSLGAGALVVVSARLWNPALLAPLPMLAALVIFTWTDPLRYGLWLGQIQLWLLALTLVAHAIVGSGRPIRGGLLLAAVGLIKPALGIVVLAWLIAKRWRALIASATGFLGASIVTAIAMPERMAEYVEILRRLGSGVLVAFNNQSYPAYFHRFLYVNEAQLKMWVLLQADPALVLVNIGLAAIALLVLGVSVRRVRRAGGDFEAPAFVGLLLIGTLFAPISWSHYFVVLAPVWVWISGRWTGPRWVLLASLTAVVALSVPPIAANSALAEFSALTVISSQMIAGTLSFAMVLVTLVPTRATAG